MKKTPFDTKNLEFGLNDIFFFNFRLLSKIKKTLYANLEFLYFCIKLLNIIDLRP